jgi:flagellar motility protein MotE (MotC chaperone)
MNSTPSQSAPAHAPAQALTATASPPAASPPPVTESEKTLLLELRQRRQELDAREQALTAREAVLAAAEGKLDQRVTELQALQQRLETLEAARNQRQDASWQGLVRLYTGMKPREAAKIFDDLETPVLLEIVDRMNERKAAPILAAMQPDRAREVTAKLAEMRTKRDTPGGQ